MNMICHSERSEESLSPQDCWYSKGFFAALRMTSADFSIYGTGSGS